MFARGSGAGRDALVIAEFALALALLMGAGLFIHSFARLLHVTPGFQAANVVTLRVQLQLSTQEEANARKLKTFYERLDQRLRSLPGVNAVAATNAPPLRTERNNVMRFVVPGSPRMRPGLFPIAHRHLITPDYFRVLGIPLRGRTYNARDLDGPYVIVNETMARTFWPGQDPVGQRFISGPFGPTPSWSTIIGVAGDIKQVGLDSGPTNDFYFLWYGPTYLMIQAAGDPRVLAPAIRREIRALDPTIAVSDFRTMEQLVDASTGPRRFSTTLLSMFAALAVVLAMIGIYGIMSWSVAQRRQEIGIRMAVGADSSGILKLIFGHGLKLSIAGLVIGLATTLALSRVLSSQLFEISPHDPWALGTVSLLMLAVTAGACYLPARRATRVDPITTLRSE